MRLDPATLRFKTNFYAKSSDRPTTLSYWQSLITKNITSLSVCTGTFFYRFRSVPINITKVTFFRSFYTRVTSQIASEYYWFCHFHTSKHYLRLPLHLPTTPAFKKRSSKRFPTTSSEHTLPCGLPLLCTTLRLPKNDNIARWLEKPDPDACR